METVNCPYCGELTELNMDNGAYYNEDRRESDYCEYCDKYFMVSAYCVWSYEAEKADCLNDGKHKYKLTNTYPKIASRMQCLICDGERELTTSEKIKYKIVEVKL